MLERWELHHAVIGEVTETGELRALWDGDAVGEIPARLLTDECPRYDLVLEPRALAPPREIAEPPTVGDALLRSSRRPTCAAARSSTGATTSSSARGPCGGRGSTRPCCACGPRCVGSRCRSTARAGSRGSTRSSVARSRSSRRLATSPVPAASRWASPTVSTSGIRRSRGRLGALGGDRRDGRGVPCARGADRVGQRVALQRDERASDPPDAGGRRGRPRADVRRVPKSWRDGDTLFVAGDGTVSLAGSEFQARFGEPEAARPCSTSTPRHRSSPSSGERRRSARSSTTPPRAASRLSRRGRALLGSGRRSSWRTTSTSSSARSAGVPCSRARRRTTPTSESLANELDVPLRRVGSVGGGAVLGVGLDRLREAWEGG